jgi:hypothetical protein
MRDIICAGCSHTSFRELEYDRVINGFTPPINTYFNNGSYPEAIHRNFGNKVYNAGLKGNSIAGSVLSIISIASRLLNQGNNNFSIILQATDFERQQLYLTEELKIIKNINKNSLRPTNNNYLFNNDSSGFLQMGGMSIIDENRYSDCKIITEMGKMYSKHIYSNENCTITSLTHLLLLQNFCKANNIPYKIFKMMDLFSSPIFPFFDLDYKNTETYFKSYFIDRKLPKKEPLGYIKSDPYMFDLFQMLDLNNMWFYSDDQVKYGGFFEWIYKNNEYKEGDNEYIALFVEDVNPESAANVSDHTHYMSVDTAKERMKNKTFFETAHPTYYYWNKFVNEVMIDWNIFKN